MFARADRSDRWLLRRRTNPVFPDVMNRLCFRSRLSLGTRRGHRVENVTIDIKRLGFRALRLNLNRCNKQREEETQSHAALHC